MPRGFLPGLNDTALAQFGLRAPGIVIGPGCPRSERQQTGNACRPGWREIDAEAYRYGSIVKVCQEASNRPGYGNSAL